MSDGIIFNDMTERKSKTSRAKSKGAALSKRQSRATVSPEYREYEERYARLGQDRPKLSPAEFEKLDDELLELLALDPDEMTDEQLVRVQELEYLLIDSD